MNNNMSSKNNVFHYYVEGECEEKLMYTSKFNTIEDFYQIAILEIGGIFLWK